MPKVTQILKSVGKTINLAKPQVYQVPRKPPLNSLVFEKLPEAKCGERVVISKPPTPQPVRVCTKEELQAMYCCPCPCDCKVKTRMSPAEKIGLILKTLAKIFLIREMIKYTWKEGLWSDAFHSSCFLQKFLDYCPEEKEPEINEFADANEVVMPDPQPCLPFIPRSDYLMYNLATCWNKVVITVFWVILEGPMEFVQFIIDLLYPKKPVVEMEPCDVIRARSY